MEDKKVLRLECPREQFELEHPFLKNCFRNQNFKKLQKYFQKH